ncbi:MAG: hypothetical protein ACLP5H_19095, partial [Desulfomonilaceae bacterium]
MVQYAIFLKTIELSQGPRCAQEEPQQPPGTHPLLEGLLPQQVEPPVWLVGSLLMDMAGADINCCSPLPP